jgi:hypothetical protein
MQSLKDVVNVAIMLLMMGFIGFSLLRIVLFFVNGPAVS